MTENESFTIWAIIDPPAALSYAAAARKGGANAMRFPVLAAVWGATLAIAAPAAGAADELTLDRLLAMDPEEMLEAPALDAMRIAWPDAPPRADLALGQQYMLARLGFYEGTPDGKENARMRRAVRAFRASRGEAEADALSLGDTGELAWRLSLFEPDRLSIPRGYWSLPNEYKSTLEIAGTFVERESQGKADIGGYYGVRNYVRIRCDPAAQSCREARLEFDWGGERAYLVKLDSAFWVILEWTPERLVIADPEAECYMVTLTLDLAAQKAERRTDHHQKPYCPNEKGEIEPYYADLVSPETLFGPGWEQEDSEREAALAPALRAVAERLRASGALDTIEGLAGFR